MPSNTQVRWIRLGEAAARIGVSVDTLRRWVDAGKVSSWRTPGGERRIAEAEVERLAQGRAS